jgi:hypothetical protein
VKVVPELLAEVKTAAVDEEGKVLVEKTIEVEVAAMTGAKRPGVRGLMKPGLGIRLGGAVRG